MPSLLTWYQRGPNILQVLLTSGVRRLLDMSAGSDAAEPWPRVHALNMLRMAFSERGLALDGTAFLAEGGGSSLVPFTVFFPAIHTFCEWLLLSTSSTNSHEHWSQECWLTEVVAHLAIRDMWCGHRAGTIILKSCLTYRNFSLL